MTTAIGRLDDIIDENLLGVPRLPRRIIKKDNMFKNITCQFDDPKEADEFEHQLFSEFIEALEEMNFP